MLKPLQFGPVITSASWAASWNDLGCPHGEGSLSHHSHLSRFEPCLTSGQGPVVSVVHSDFIFNMEWFHMWYKTTKNMYICTAWHVQ